MSSRSAAHAPTKKGTLSIPVHAPSARRPHLISRKELYPRYFQHTHARGINQACLFDGHQRWHFGLATDKTQRIQHRDKSFVPE